MLLSPTLRAIFNPAEARAIPDLDQVAILGQEARREVLTRAIELIKGSNMENQEVNPDFVVKEERHNKVDA